MRAKILKGKPVADALMEKIKAKVEKLGQQGICPQLAIVRVGADESDLAYERSAVKRAEKAGIQVKNVVLPETISQEELIAEIDRLNNDDAVNGILLFRPLPAHIDDAAAGQSILPAKDIDGITDLSLAGIFTGADTGFPPCTARACMEILDYYDIPIKGKKAAVVGRSLVVGRPLAMMLTEKKRHSSNNVIRRTIHRPIWRRCAARPIYLRLHRADQNSKKTAHKQRSDSNRCRHQCR